MMKRQVFILSFVLFVICVFSCENVELNADEILIKPNEDLSAEELTKFQKGKDLFEHSFALAEGLGPVFIASNCESCHFKGGKGHPFNEIVRYGKWADSGEFDDMNYKSGPQLQYRAINGYPAEEIPQDAEGIVHLNPPALAGLGFLEAISDETILNWQDAGDANNDGISGRAAFVNTPHNLDEFENADIHESHYIEDGKRIGRFGKKAFSINLFQQTARALKEDIGITTFAEIDDPFNYKASSSVIFEGDGVENPELSNLELDNLVFFMRSSAIPPRRNASNPEVLNGELLFDQIGCINCHKANIQTSNTKFDFLSNKTIHPYTDLLLHDMGEKLDDNYTEGDAESSEWRTPPLWGIGLVEFSQGGNAFYLHDGRAQTLNDAILFHGGEAQQTIDQYLELNAAQQDDIVSFLKSL